MKKHVLFLLLVASCTKPTSTTFRLGMLNWLEGSWVRENPQKGARYEEHWSRPHPKIMLGFNRTVEGDKVTAFEHIQILETDSKVIYTAWPHGQSMTSFELAVLHNKQAVFENPAHDFPQRVTYRRDAQGLQAEIAGTIQKKQRKIGWHWNLRLGPAIFTDRRLFKSVVVSAPPEAVWRAWTTTSGARTFFAPQALIEPRPGGRYELYFNPKEPRGKRGSEGCMLVELSPRRRLAFTWNFPVSLPFIRDAHTLVTVTLTPLDPNSTRVQLEQTGWQIGEQWDRGFQYFDRAWGIVMNLLQRRFAKGPVDWSGEAG